MADLVTQLSQEDWFKELRYDQKAKAVNHYNSLIEAKLKEQQAPDNYINQFKQHNVQAFEDEHAPSNVETFLGALHDIAVAPARTAADVNQLLWGVASHVPGLKEIAEQNIEATKNLKEGDVLGAKTPYMDYYQAATEAAAMGGGTAWLMRTMGVAKHAPFLKNLGQIEKASTSAAKGALVSGAGEIGVVSTMKNYVEPKVLKSELSSEAKQTILLATPMLLGVLSGIGPENVADNLLKNQAFTGAIERAMKNGVTPSKVVKSPEIMKDLAEKAGGSEEDVKNVVETTKQLKETKIPKASTPEQQAADVVGEHWPRNDLMFRADGKPFGSKQAAGRALARRGLQNEYELFRIGKGEWAFKPKHSREKITQVEQPKTSDVKQDQLQFQSVKDWKEKTPGQFTYEQIDEVMPEEAIKNELPLAYEFMNSKVSGVQKSRPEGYTRSDIHGTLRSAYQQIKPGEPRADRMLRILDEVETLAGKAYENRPAATRQEIDIDLKQLVDDNVIDEKQKGIIGGFLDSLSESPNFRVYGSKVKGDSFYHSLSNMVELGSPSSFFHEAGHWAFYNVMSKQERLNFAEALMNKYNSRSSWNKLIPSRKKVKEGMTKLFNKGQISDEFYHMVHQHFDNPLELYADMISQYVWNRQLTAPEFDSMIHRASTVMKKWFNSIKKYGDKIPDDMQAMVDRVFRSPDPREYKPMRFEDNSQELTNHVFYIPKEELSRGIQQDPEANVFMNRIIGEEADIFTELQRSNINVEKVLDNLWVETHKWYHGLDPAYGRDELRYVYERLARFFDPNNKAEALQSLKVSGFREGTRGAGPTRRLYNQGIDAQTGGEARALTAQERASRAEAARMRQWAEDHAASEMYRAYKQMWNDTFGLFEALDARKLDDFLPGKMPRLQWLRKNSEDLMNRGVRIDGGWQDEGNPYVDAFRELSAEDLKKTTTSAFSRQAPMLISGAMGITFDQENGVPIPGTGMRVGWDPMTWATRGWSVGLPFSDERVPIGAGPLLLAAAGGYTPRRVARGLKGVVGKMYDKTGEMRPEVRRFVETRRKRVNEIMNSDFVRSFRPAEGLTGRLAEIRKLGREEELGIAREVRKMAKEINKNFTHDEQRQIADIIEKVGDDALENVDERLVHQADEIRGLNRQIRDMLIDAGYPEETLNKLGDNYLHRIYSRTMKRRARKAAGIGKGYTSEAEQFSRAWKSIFGDYLKSRGLAQSFERGSPVFNDLMTATNKQLKKGEKVYDVGAGDERYFIHESQKELLKRFKDENLINHQWEVDYISDKRNGKVTLRRDFTELERQDLGEIKEVVPRMIQYSKMVSRDLALANTYRRIANTDHVIDPKKLSQEDILNYKDAGWAELDNSEIFKGAGVKKYGMLAGKLVSPEAQYLVKASGNFRSSKLFNNKAFRAYNKLTRAWKIGKTAFNPGTHGRNFVANLHMCVLDGKNPASILAQGADHIRRKTDLFQQAIDEGMLDSQFLRAEVEVDDFMDIMSKAKGAHNSELAQSMFDQFITGASRTLKKGARAPMRIYELGDEVFKMGYIADAVKRGKTVKEGLDEAQESFFDYRDIPSGVQAIRDTGLMPFVTYTYKIIPKLAKVMADHPHRALGILLAYELLNEYSFASDYGERKEAGEAYERKMMPDWMGGRVLGFGPQQTARLPGGDQEMAEYYDFMGNIPGGDALSPHGVFGNYPFGFHPLMSSIYGMATERTPMFDKEFQVSHKDLERGTAEQWRTFAKERATFLAQTWGPNLPYPGQWSYDSLGNAVVAEINKYRESEGLEPIEVDALPGSSWTGKDYYGTYDSLPEELVGFFGLGKIRRYYPEQEYRMSQMKLYSEISKRPKDIERAGKDFRTTEQELETMKEGAKSLFERNKQIMRELKNLRRGAKGSLID
jgi:hypothetical protein